MTTYYVKPAGDDGKDGLSLANAWATLNKAATTAVAGDTVNFDDGTYSIGQGQSSWNSGTSGNPVTFQAINRRAAIWKKSANDGAIVDLSTYDYVTIIGIVMDGDFTANAYTSWRMVELDGSQDIIIDDCEIKDGEARCIYCNSHCTNITIQNCTIHQDNYEDGESNDGIFTHFSSNADITIQNNTIYNIDHVGIYINGGENVTVKGNTVHTTHSHLVQYGSPGAGSGWPISGLIEGNTLYGSEDYGPADPEGHTGIYVTGGDVDDVTIQLNDIYDTDTHGIQVGANVAGPIEIFNNTIYDFNRQLHATGAGIQLNDGSAGISVEVKNNIFYSTRAAGLVYRVTGADMNAGLDSDYNLFFADPGAVDDIYRNGVTYTTFPLYQAAFSPNAVIDDDPDFTNAGAGDFTLLVGSPAIDAGVDVGLPFNEPAPDIGAHEYEGAPPTPPAAGDAAVTFTYQVKYASMD